MDDPKKLEFLATKSKEMVEKQVASYRQKHSNAGIIIGVIAIFIPFFLNGLENSYLLIQVLSLIPICLLFWAVIVMLNVLRTKLLYQFFSVDKFKDLVNQDYSEILLYEIGANNDSFRDNKPIDKKINDKYNFGIKLTTVAILISVALLITNKFYQPVRLPVKVELIKSKVMTDQEKPVEKPIIIPSVPPGDREQLNEGVDKPKPTAQPMPKPSTKGK